MTPMDRDCRSCRYRSSVHAFYGGAGGHSAELNVECEHPALMALPDFHSRRIPGGNIRGCSKWRELECAVPVRELSSVASGGVA